MVMQARPRLSPEEYLAAERASETKSEYVGGEVYAMTGASRRHNLVTANVTTSLVSQLRGRPCETYTGGMRVRVSRTGAYVYPDVVVVCGEPEFEGRELDTLLNPSLVVEVLSPSTAAYDHGVKWEHYRRLPSLQEYLLIGQDRARVERYTRQGEGLWLFSETEDPAAVIDLASIGCSLDLRDVYDKVPEPDNR